MKNVVPKQKINQILKISSHLLGSQENRSIFGDYLSNPNLTVV